MSAAATFVLGLLVGWLIEWFIDWIYWRRRQSSLQNELSLANSKLSSAETSRADLERQLAALKIDHAKAQGKVAALEAEKVGPASHLPAQAVFAGVEQEKQPAASAMEQPETRKEMISPEVKIAGVDSHLTSQPSLAPDDLQVIKGIGPVISKKLNQAGIYTFRELASITPDRLREIVGDVIQRLANEDSLIGQAKILADKKDQVG